MEQAANELIGTHDFSPFTTEPQENSTRTLFSIQIVPLPNQRLRIDLIGDRFLYKMARTIVGTLANIGSGKLPFNHFPSKRTEAGVTAPAHGLALEKVFYSSVLN